MLSAIASPPVLSPAILQGILEVLYRPLLRERFPQMASLPELHEVLRILDMAEVVEPTVRLRVCRDPNDDKFLECAVAGEAEYIISEDQDLLTLKEFQGVKVLSVAEFIGFLEGQEEQSTSSMGERTTD